MKNEQKELELKDLNNVVGYERQLESEPLADLILSHFR